MQVREIWRYPVKSMAGELLEAAELTAEGVAGDRVVQVRDPAGRVVTARTRPLLLRHSARLTSDGEVLVDGRPWTSEEVAADVEAAAGAGARLVRAAPSDRFDILPLLVATDGMLAATGYDRRRFRPNLVIGGVPGLGEREWEGCRLRIGSAVIAMEDLRVALHHDHLRPRQRRAGPGRSAPDPARIQRPARAQQLRGRARPHCGRRCRGTPSTRMTTFLGIDLGWYGKPSGLASLVLEGSGLRLRDVTRLENIDEILGWIETQAAGGDAVAAVDAPLVIPNQAGIRPAEREVNRHFRRFHAGCHAANLGRPFAAHVISFSRRLEAMGFVHGATMTARQQGRFQIEVHPHAATITLFGLDRIVKYKRGTRAERARGLNRLRSLALARLPVLDPPLTARLPAVPPTGNLKPIEDRIDAVLCAYIAAHWWFWGRQRNTVYGSEAGGYIVIPSPLSMT